MRANCKLMVGMFIKETVKPLFSKINKSVGIRSYSEAPPAKVNRVRSRTLQLLAANPDAPLTSLIRKFILKRI